MKHNLVKTGKSSRHRKATKNSSDRKTRVLQLLQKIKKIAPELRYGQILWHALALKGHLRWASKYDTTVINQIPDQVLEEALARCYEILWRHRGEILVRIQQQRLM